MRRQGAATMEVIRAAAKAAAEMGVDTILMVAPPLKCTSNTLTANLGTTKDATRSSKPYARKKEICREGREMVGTINCLKLLCPPQCLSPKFVTRVRRKKVRRSPVAAPSESLTRKDIPKSRRTRVTLGTPQPPRTDYVHSALPPSTINCLG
ncbi:hypothetical protein OROMI_022308 [Orobanche minor]